MEAKEKFLKEALQFLAEGNTEKFFERLGEDLLWVIETVHPVTGNPISLHKKDIRGVFESFQHRASSPLTFRIRHIYPVVGYQEFVVQLDALGTYNKTQPYENHQCWIITIGDNPMRIIDIKGYVDSFIIDKFYKETQG